MKKLKIDVPEGYEIDLETSNLEEGIVRFKPKKVKLSYSRIAKGLFKERRIQYFTDTNGNIRECSSTEGLADPNNAPSRKQLECLMAHNKLRNVAEYLNNKWKPVFSSSNKNYYIVFNHKVSAFEIKNNSIWNTSSVYFNSEELAKQAIEILGEDEVKKALFMNI